MHWTWRVHGLQFPAVSRTGTLLLTCSWSLSPRAVVGDVNPRLETEFETQRAFWGLKGPLWNCGKSKPCEACKGSEPGYLWGLGKCLGEVV